MGMKKKYGKIISVRKDRLNLINKINAYTSHSFSFPVTPAMLYLHYMPTEQDYLFRGLFTYQFISRFHKIWGILLRNSEGTSIEDICLGILQNLLQSSGSLSSDTHPPHFLYILLERVLLKSWHLQIYLLDITPRKWGSFLLQAKYFYFFPGVLYAGRKVEDKILLLVSHLSTLTDGLLHK